MAYDPLAIDPWTGQPADPAASARAEEEERQRALYYTGLSSELPPVEGKTAQYSSTEPESDFVGPPPEPIASDASGYDYGASMMPRTRVDVMEPNQQRAGRAGQDRPMFKPGDDTAIAAKAGAASLLFPPIGIPLALAMAAGSTAANNYVAPPPDPKPWRPGDTPGVATAAAPAKAPAEEQKPPKMYQDPTYLTYDIVGASRGTWVPEHEQQEGRRLSIEHGIPIPDEAMDRYKSADELRRESARAEVDAARKAGMLDSARKIGEAEIEIEAARRQQQLADMQAREYEHYRTAYENMAIDPNRVWDNKSTLGKVAAIIGMAMGAFAASRGGPNVAMELLKAEIDRDIEAQRANRQVIGQSLAALGMKHETEDKDLDLEKAKRLRAVAMKYEEQLSKAGITDQGIMAEHQRAIADLENAAGDLIDRAAQRAAGKSVEEFKYKQVQGQYVGGSAGRKVWNNAHTVYDQLFRQQVAAGKDPAEAHKIAQTRMVEAGMKTSEVANVAIEVGTARTPEAYAAMRSGAPDDETSVFHPVRQKALQENLVTLDDGTSYYVGSLGPSAAYDIQKRLMFLNGLSDAINKMEEVMNMSEGRIPITGGSVPLSERSAKADVWSNRMQQLVHRAVTSEALSEADRDYLIKIIPAPGDLTNFRGPALLNAIREYAESNKRNQYHTVRNQGWQVERRMHNGMPLVVPISPAKSSIPNPENEVTGGNTGRGRK